MNQIQNVSKVGLDHIQAVREREKADPRMMVSMKDACIMLGLKLTSVQNLVTDGSLVAVLDGGKRLIVVASIYDRLVSNIARAYPADGKPAKAHEFYGKRPHELKAGA